jgi:hypothetical protein
MLSLVRTGRVLLPCQVAYYSTLPKQASGKFTSNKQIAQPIEGKINIQQTLVYIGKKLLNIYKDVFIESRLSQGPFTETMKRYKMTASFFGLCGIFAVPALLSTGQAPALSVALGKKREGSDDLCVVLFFVDSVCFGSGYIVHLPRIVCPLVHKWICHKANCV